MNTLFDYITQPTIAVYHYNDVPIIFCDDWFNMMVRLGCGFKFTYSDAAKQASTYIYNVTNKQEIIFMVMPNEYVRELQWNNKDNCYYDADTNLII